MRLTPHRFRGTATVYDAGPRYEQVVDGSTPAEVEQRFLRRHGLVRAR